MVYCFAQSAEDYYKQADELSKNDKCDEAMRMINKALLLDSMNAEYYNLKAGCLQELKRYKESFAVYTKGIEKNPKESFLYNNRGNLLLTIAEFDYAVRDFSRAIDLATNDSVRRYSYTNRAAAKLSKRDFISGYNDLMTAYHMDSTDVATLINLGSVCDEIGKGDETLKYLLKAVELDPKAIGAYGNIGFKYQELGQYEKAIEYFNKILEMDPKEPLAFSNRSYNRYKLGDIKGAMEDINKSILIYADNSYAYRIRALIYIEMKDYDKACADLNKALDKGFTVTYGDEVNQLIKKYCKIN
jgi:tetratricopeptide (TPR) repeat protein